ncbi:MAG: zinc-binding dehydrogenase, partial [Nitrospinota bacterium]
DLHIGVDGSLPVPAPRVLGHEVSGVVREVGPEARRWRHGDRVAVFPSIACGRCSPCRKGREALCVNARMLGIHEDGGMAEFLLVPESCLMPLPEGIPFEVGAIVSDAVSTAYRAVLRRGALRPGESVAVFGTGGLGYHALLLSRLLGAGRVIAVDRVPGLLDRALAAGADHVVDAREGEPAKRIKALTGGEGVDLALEFVGLKETVTEAMKALGRGGRAVVAGVGIERVETAPLRVFVGNEHALLASMGFDREDVRRVIELAESGRLDLSRSVSAALPLEQVNEAIDRVARKVGDPIRLVIRP